MQIIGYELDTAMNIKYFKLKLTKKSLILWSEFDQKSWPVSCDALCPWRLPTWKPMFAYYADVMIHTSLPALVKIT